MLYILLLYIPLVLFCAHAIIWLYGWRARRMLAGLPSFPYSLPLLGHANQIYGDGEVLMGVLSYISNVIEEMRLPFKLFIGPSPCVMVSHPEDVKAVTTTFIEKPYFYRLCKDFVGGGLLLAPVQEWKQNIKKLGGTFNATTVDGYQDIFNALSAKLVRNLKTEVANGRRSLNVLEEHLGLITFQVISQTALGIPNELLDEVISPKHLYAHHLSHKLFIDRLKNIIFHSDFIYKFNSDYQESMKCRDVLHGVCQRMLLMRRQARKEMTKNLTDSVKKTRLKPYIDVLLDMQESDPSMTDEYLKHEVLTIIVGGFDTISLSVLYTLITLGYRPDIQEELYAEMKSIFGDSKRPVTKEDMAQMPYCEALIKESLRLYPPAPMVLRYADKDLQIKSCTIPKGTNVGVSIWGANRLKSVYGKDSEEFRPERWLEDGLSDSSPSFLSFSYGRRSCIGRRYAMPLQKTILAHTVRELMFETFDVDQLRLTADITVKPSRTCPTTIKIIERPLKKIDQSILSEKVMSNTGVAPA